ncbi:hypothetical protein [Nonomuraea typhae]|uniref:Uncharacterized protein n=1 Tax=Nonomuraea typhae TaxID=2603600 RepID=A0ABW7Z1N7_9ACTN
MPDPWARVPDAAVSGLGYGKYLAHATLAAGAAACAIVWAGWPIVSKLYVHQYDTGALAKGYQDLVDAAGDLGEGRSVVGELVGGLGAEQWPGQSRRDFEEWMRGFAADLKDEEFLSRSLGILILVSAAVLFAFVVYTSVVVMRLAWMALKVLRMSVGGGVGFLAAQVTVGAEARALYAQVEMMEKKLAFTLHGLAGTITSMLAVRVGKDGLTGDRQGLADLRQATISQGPALIWGVANHVERNLTAAAMRGRSPLAKGKPRPISSVDDLAVGKLQMAAAAKGAFDVISGRMPTGFFVPERYDNGAYEGYEEIERRV